jgi:hypothetical protein
VGGDEAEQGALLAQWNEQDRATAGPDRETTLQGLCSGPGVGDLHITFAAQQPLMEAGVAIRLAKLFDPKLGHPAMGGEAEIFAVIGDQCAMLDAAKGVRLLKNSVEHRGEVAGRGIDDLQHLGGRGLLLS